MVNKALVTTFGRFWSLIEFVYEQHQRIKNNMGSWRLDCNSNTVVHGIQSHIGNLSHKQALKALKCQHGSSLILFFTLCFLLPKVIDKSILFGACTWQTGIDECSSGVIMKTGSRGFPTVAGPATFLDEITNWLKLIGFKSPWQGMVLLRMVRFWNGNI